MTDKQIKYIIKNCPAISQYKNIFGETINSCFAVYNMDKSAVILKAR